MSDKKGLAKTDFTGAINTTIYKKQKYVSVIELHGGVGPGTDKKGQMIQGNKGLSLHLLRESIENAFSWNKACAVILDVDSPGGNPSDAWAIGRAIRRHAEFSRKPVYAFVHTDATSAGYWLACAADHIFALPTSNIGSIGVIAQGYGYHERDKKRGIERRIVTAGKKKSILDEHKPLQAWEIAKMQEIVDDTHKEFKAWIIERRGDRLIGKPKDLMNGDFWKARRALERGLIDGLGDRIDVMGELLKAKVNFKVFGPCAEIDIWRARLTP